MIWHMEDIIVVFKDGPGPHPWFNNCNMFITHETMAEGYLVITMCKIRGKRKHHHLAATAAQLASGTEFRAQDQVLEKRMLLFDDREWPVMVRNLHKDWSKWGRLSYLMYRKGG